MAGFIAADKPRFFKVILDPTISNKRLMIPTSFSRKHYASLSNPKTATITVPSGLRWRVKLHKTTLPDDGQPEVWIQGDAWEHFASYHRLGKGHFIVFQYEGDSNFSLFVFAISGSEIRYPFGVVKDVDDDITMESIPNFEDHHPPKKYPKSAADGATEENRGGYMEPKMEENAEEYKDDIFMEILSDSDTEPSWKRISPEKQNVASEKNRGGFQDSKMEENAEEYGDDVSVEILSDSDSGPSGRRRSPEKLTDDVSVEILTDSDSGPSRRRRTPKKQSMVNPKSRLHHPWFRVVMRKTYLRYNYVCIPREFAREYFKWREQTLKLIQVADHNDKKKKKKKLKQEWLVEVVRVKGRDEMHIARKGWSAFAKANCLRLGDVCKFEVIVADDDVLRVLQVSIYRSRKKMYLAN